MIKVTTDYTMRVPTAHPAQEAREAKERCDRLKADGTEDCELQNVSTDAAGIYEYYGRNVLGLDIHYFLCGKEVSFQDLFDSFNKSFAIVEQYGRDDEEPKQKEDEWKPVDVDGGKTETKMAEDYMARPNDPLIRHDVYQSFIEEKIKNGEIVPTRNHLL